MSKEKQKLLLGERVEPGRRRREAADNPLHYANTFRVGNKGCNEKPFISGVLLSRIFICESLSLIAGRWSSRHELGLIEGECKSEDVEPEEDGEDEVAGGDEAKSREEDNRLTGGRPDDQPGGDGCAVGEGGAGDEGREYQIEEEALDEPVAHRVLLVALPEQEIEAAVDEPQAADHDIPVGQPRHQGAPVQVHRAGQDQPRRDDQRQHTEYAPSCKLLLVSNKIDTYRWSHISYCS